MKKLLSLWVALFLAAQLFAQSEVNLEKVKEIGIGFYNLKFNSFSAFYRTGKQTALWRVKTIFVNGNQEFFDDEDRSEKSFNFGFGFGREYRKNINNHLAFRYGLDLNFRYAYRKNQNSGDETKVNSYKPGLSLVLGFNYTIEEKWVVGLDFLPEVSYSYSESKFTNSLTQSRDISRTLNYILDNQILLSLSHRF